MRTVITTTVITVISIGAILVLIFYSGFIRMAVPVREALCEQKMEAARKFKTEEEIRHHYGAIYRIRLKDGRSFTGFVVLRGDRLILRLKNGVIEIGGDMWDTIQQVE